MTRDAKRRGLGWLAGQAHSGWSNRLGWYEGFHLLLSVTPSGVMTGFGFGPASTHDQHLAETWFVTRQMPSPRLPSTGLPAQDSSVADKGEACERPRQRWHQQRQVDLVAPPHQTSKRIRLPKALRRWLAGVGQIIETVNDTLLNTFRLARERPHGPLGLPSSFGCQSEFAQFLHLVQSASEPGFFSLCRFA